MKRRRTHIPFLGQRLRSNYCGVLCTGMLLSLCGRPTTREQALRLFQIQCQPRPYPGASARLIRHRFLSELPHWDARWESLGRCSLRRLVATVRRLTTVGPVVLVLHAVRRSMRVRHAVIALAADARSGITILDPLGPPPRDGCANSVIGLERTRRGLYRVGHGLYSADLGCSVSLLVARPPASLPRLPPAKGPLTRRTRAVRGS